MRNIQLVETYKLIYFIYFIFIFLVMFSSISILSIKLLFWGKIAYIILLLVLFIYFVNKGFLSKNNFIFWMVFSLPLWLSFIFNINEGVNLFRTLNFVLFYPLCFFVFFCFLYTYGLKKTLFPLMASFFIILILSLMQITGIYEFNFYSENSDYLEFYNEISMRDGVLAVTGIYLNQNILASVMMVSIYCFFIYYYLSKGWQSYLIIFLVFLSFFTLLLTMARASIFSLLIGFFVFLFFSNLRVYIKILFLLFGFFVFIFFYNSDYYDLFLTRVSDSGLSYRDVIWSDALAYFEKNLFFGLGLGNYTFFENYRFYSTHNFYLFLLVSLGVFGSSSILLFFLIFIRRAIMVFFNAKENLLFICVILSSMIHQFFEVTLDSPFNPLSLFFILTISYFFKTDKE